MAEQGLAPAEISTQERIESAPSNGADFSDRHSEITPVNKYGVVIPPEYHQCIGEGCKFRGENHNCQPTRHHLHSTEPDYISAGPVAQEYRELQVLTVWLPKCRHEIHHQQHSINIEIPSTEVMQYCIEKAKLVRDMVRSQREINGISRLLDSEVDATYRRRKGLKRRRQELSEQKNRLIEEVNTIEIIPEELITGALLVVAPKVARGKISLRSRAVMTGTMLKSEIPRALNESRKAKDYLDRLQTGVDAVQLAA
jgi:hypothetical protein